MRLPSLKKLSRVLTALFQMVQLAWEAHPAGVAGIILVNIMLGLVPVATAWVTKLIFDLLAKELQAGASSVLPESLVILLIVQVTILVLSRSITPISSYIHSEAARRLTLKVQSSIYRKINSLVGLAPFEDPRFYDTLRLAAGGAEHGPPQALTISMNLLQSAVTLAGLLSLLLSFSPLLAAMVSLTVLPQLYTQFKISRQRYNLVVETNPKERYATYYGYVLSAPQFAKEIRLFNVGEYFLGTLLSTFKEVHQVQRRQQKRELKWQAALAVFTSLVAGGAFALVILEAFAAHISIGDVILYVSAVASLQASLTHVSAALAGVNQNVLFYAHYTKLLALPQPLPLAGNTCSAPVLRSSIEFRNVSFRYSEGHPWVLCQLNLFIPANRCTALVGLNGTGKTTLIKLLMRMYDPTEGQVLWDGIDIREFDPIELRRRISAVFQDFAHYDLTAQENIGLGDVDHIGCIDRVRLAAEQAGIHDTIEGLPNGYRTVLSRWLAPDGPGVDLSGGEWQKIALARMFIRPADVLVLDEPTSSLDAQAEHEIFNQFTELVKERTALLITHRFSTVQMADLIAVLEGGRITEYGSHDELLAIDGAYARLYRVQAELYR